MNQSLQSTKAEVMRSFIIFCLILCTFIAIFICLKNRGSSEFENIDTAYIQAKLSKQEKIDGMLRVEMDSGFHPIEKPLVVLDPYGISPLSAIVLFRTNEQSRISVSIQGKDSLSTVEFAFNGYFTKHLIPIYGLYPDKSNQVMIFATNRKGIVQETRIKIITEKLVPRLKNVVVEIQNSENDKIQKGFNFLFLHSPKFAFDHNGDIRWVLDWLTLPSTLYDYNGHIIAAAGSNHYGKTLLYEIDPLGRMYSINSIFYGVHHDIIQIDNGNLLITGSDGGPTVEDFLYEINPRTGNIENVLDFKKILDQERPSLSRTNQDWMHFNAITWSKSDSSILVSARHQSAIFKLSYPVGKLKWILADHDNWLPDYLKYLFSPIGSSFEWQYVQHSPILLPDQDGDADTIDLLLFDNHSFMKKKELYTDHKDLYSRLVQYRINEKEKTVKQVWEFGKDRGLELFTNSGGGVGYLKNGNFIGFFNLENCHRIAYSRLIEIQSISKNVVFDALIYDKNHAAMGDYRATRRDLYSLADNSFYMLEPCKNNLQKEMEKNAKKH